MTATSRDLPTSSLAVPAPCLALPVDPSDSVCYGGAAIGSLLLENAMTRKKPYKPIMSGVSFQPAVIDYLDRACDLENCDRSALINRIVREHAGSQGSELDEPDAGLIRRTRMTSRAI